VWIESNYSELSQFDLLDAELCNAMAELYARLIVVELDPLAPARARPNRLSYEIPYQAISVHPNDSNF